ncbi:hypothetical protein AWJ07_04300 [Shewanella frigidimarina]|uniref:Lipoprotein n=2 Tax=Shewanella frigidimarina TaxID=56812 RepID=A0A119CZR8_SHEFR|nr:hypothetical protein AWJ07_04300 [Shewanella frigidimarina]
MFIFGEHAFFKVFMKSVFSIALRTSMLMVLFLSGCSANQKFHNTTDFAVKDIDTYSSTEIANFNAHFLGDVTTAYCENSSNPDRLIDIPSLSSMTNSLKLQVSKLGGNVIVMKQCGIINYLSCAVYLECNGEAYAIDRGL